MQFKGQAGSAIFRNPVLQVKPMAIQNLVL